MKRKLIVLLIILLLGANALYGCRTGTPNAANASPDVLPSASPEVIPAAGGDLRIPMPLNPSSPNPLMVNTKEMRAVFSLVFESLLQYDANNRLTPALAESWTADESGESWMIRLRKGVTWHGVADELTARDVVYTYNQLKSEAMASSIYRANIRYIEDMAATDDYTLVVTGVEPGNAALYALTFPIVSERFANMDAPIGTGPFRVAGGMDAGAGMELIRNERWWKQPPYIERVIAVPQTNNSTALAALELRQLDFVPTSILTASQYREQDVADIIDVTTSQCEFLIPNLTNEILAEPGVRKAIAFALDRRDLVSRAYLNHAFACDVPIQPQSWLYDTKFKLYDYNLARARTLLEQAGWQDVNGDGILDKQIGARVESLRLRLLTNVAPDNPLHRDVAELIRDQLLRAGIEVEVDAQEWTTADTPYLTMLQTGSFDLALCTFNLDQYPDLRFLLGSQGESNYGKYSSPRMDELMDAARHETDEREIKARFMELQQLIVDELPVITLFFRTSSIVYDAGLVGVESAKDPEVFRNADKWFYKDLARQSS